MPAAAGRCRLRRKDSSNPNFTGALRRRGEAWEETSAEDARRFDEAYRSGGF